MWGVRLEKDILDKLACPRVWREVNLTPLHQHCRNSGSPSLDNGRPWQWIRGNWYDSITALRDRLFQHWNRKDLVLGAKTSLAKLEFAWRNGEAKGREGRRAEGIHAQGIYNGGWPKQSDPKSHRENRRAVFQPRLRFFFKAANRPLNKYWDSWQPRQKGFALVISRETTYSPGLRRGPRVCSQFYLQSPKNWLLLHSNTIIYLVLKAKTKINTHSFLPHHQTQEAFLHCWYLPQVQCDSLPQCKIPKNQTCITEWSCEFSMEKPSFHGEPPIVSYHLNVTLSITFEAMEYARRLVGMNQWSLLALW